MDISESGAIFITVSEATFHFLIGLMLQQLMLTGYLVTPLFGLKCLDGCWVDRFYSILTVLVEVQRSIKNCSSAYWPQLWFIMD